jgi:protocatechuate 3,4-dioxygenase beta subunit
VRVPRRLAILALFGAAVGVWAAGVPFAERYARAYEIELVNGNLEEAVTQYRAIAEEAGTADPSLASRALLRAALCQRKLDRPVAARETLRQLAESRQADDATRVRVKRELRALDEELDRVTIRGRVVDPKGVPVAGANVLVGQWTVEPPVLTGTDGTFVAVRRLDEFGTDGRHYGLLFAEHPLLPLVAFGAVISRGGRTCELDINLQPSVALGGRVTDPTGRGVEGASVSVTGVARGVDPIPLPVDRVLAPVLSGTNGQFWVGNLGRGIRWRLSARKAGYRLVQGTEFVADADRPFAGDMVMEPISSQSISGKVLDPDGKPLRASVTVWTMPPDVRKIADTQTDEEGNYAALNLSDELVTVKAVAGAAMGGSWAASSEAGTKGATVERSFTGVRPGAGKTDFEIRSTSPAAPVAERGKAAPELAAIPLRGGSLTLSQSRGRPLVLYFWSRQRLPRPSLFVQRLAERYSKRGLRVLCVHDQSGNAADLAATYAPGTRPETMNSLTWTRYGAACGTLALIGRDGTLLLTGMVDEPVYQIRMEEAVEEQIGSMGAVDRLFPVSAVNVGHPVPLFMVERWIRGDSVTGQALRPEDLLGKIVIIHFGSVYVAASLRNQFPREGDALGQLAKMYAGRGVVLVWILPSEENDESAGRLAAELAPEAIIGVDRGGESYRAFGAGEAARNIVASPKGIVRAVCTDQQLFRTVKDLAVQ